LHYSSDNESAYYMALYGLHSPRHGTPQITASTLTKAVVIIKAFAFLHYQIIYYYYNSYSRISNSNYCGGIVYEVTCY